tara:strand:+ start:374 stop:673 length:300 start_codon:yes stop_codon:yes gene_type:complete
MAFYKNIAANETNLDVTSTGDFISSPTEIYMSNTSSNVLSATLFLVDANNNLVATLINTVEVPVGSALILESKAVRFNPRIHKLRITTTGNATCSIIIT